MFSEKRAIHFSLALLLVSMSGVFCIEASAQVGGEGMNAQEEILRDPTAPLFSNAASQPQTNLFSLVSSYKVTSILLRPNMKVAVINSRQVREGDVIGNAEVVKIDKNTVTLQVAGENQVLELYGRSVKTLTKGEE